MSAVPLPLFHLAARRSTSQLPTTAPSATSQTIRTCSGRLIPHPTQTGRSVHLLILETSSLTSGGASEPAPVTPVRETAYSNPEDREQTASNRASVLVGAARNIVSKPADRLAPT